MEKGEIEETKRKNIVEMAIGFTVMMRVFKKGSINLIKGKLADFLFYELEAISTKEDFDRIHNEFCEWFVKNITMATKDEPVSYGHAAKVLDIVLKVYVYYCGLPNPEKAQCFLPFLNSGIDNPIFKNLYKKYLKDDGYKSNDIYPYFPTLYKYFLENNIPLSGIISLTSIVGKDVYDFLQRLVRLDILRSFKDQILPVQYDDIMWRRLNREDDD